ncbi:hypothetical protein GYMLUDRAFT_65240 [Collybiopsis luxurians FD-317 M1]|uniref:Uncharacterized protein n=1 Tax=Collybiopsis luxurians FD-317 M1 TaxID=944289 RepID=A0A0D0B8S3_9AGAR|nr:hypothetical protein GYMLUDRAFT_65240 [Collybiopsis luxurians FD-317 M1]
MGKKSKKSQKSDKKNKEKQCRQSYEDYFDPQEYLAEIFDYLKRHSPSIKDFLHPPVVVDDKAFDLIENLQLEVSDWLDGCFCDEDYEDYVFDTFLEFIHRDWPHLWKWQDAFLRASWIAIPPIDPGLSIDEQTIRAQCHFRRDDLAWLTMKLFSHILQTSRQTFRSDSVRDILTVFSESPGFHFVLARTWIAAAEWKYGEVYSQSVAGGVFDYASDAKALDEDSARQLALALRDSFTEDGMSLQECDYR